MYIYIYTYTYIHIYTYSIPSGQNKICTNTKHDTLQEILFA